MNNADSISRSTGASKHHFAVPYNILRDVLFYFSLFFGGTYATNNSFSLRCSLCFCEVNNSLFFILNRSLVRLMCSFGVSVFLVRLCLKFCRWSLSTMFLQLFRFFSSPFCTFEFYIFNIPTHKNSTKSSPRICNSCTQRITILHLAHKHRTHPICCVSRNHLHRSMTMVVMLTPPLLLLLVLANDDYAVSLSLQHECSTLRSIHSLFFVAASLMTLMSVARTLHFH